MRSVSSSAVENKQPPEANRKRTEQSFLVSVKEIEDMFETDKDELVGEYNFEITGMVEAGESTFQCNREDPSVTIYYSIEFEWLEVSVIEWNGDSIWF